MRRLALLALLTLIARQAAAEGLDLAGVGARATARAGVGVVSSDDGAALYYNPAGLARRSDLRLQAGLSLCDRSLSFDTASTFVEGVAPTVKNRAGVDSAPFAGVEGGGETVVLGAALLVPSRISYRFATPLPNSYDYDPMRDDRFLYPQRYAGTRLELRRRALGAGAAVRALPWLAVGAAALVFDVSLEQGRVLWAGAPNVAPGTLAELSPELDMDFAADADAHFVPGASLGVIIAPADFPLELGLSLLWSADAELSGAPTLKDSRGATPIRQVTAQVAGDARAELSLPQPLTLRAGVRFVSARVVVELNGELAHFSGDAAPAWSLSGVSVTPSGATTPQPLVQVPLGPAFQDGFALRGAVDVDVVEGMLAVTAGYAWSGALVARPNVHAALPDADSHTLALGVEGRVASGLVSLGVSRTQRIETSVAAEEAAVLVVDPLGAIGLPAASGTYRGGTTLVSVGLEVALP